VNTDVANLDEAIEKSKKTLAEAEAVRAQELAEFNKEDKDAIQAVQGLHGAVTVLSKHNAAALSQEAMLQLKDVLKHVDHDKLRKIGMPRKQQHIVMSFLQQPTGATSYNSNSGEIFGVLSSMKESFETNMVNARKEEEQAANEFASLKKAKTEELGAATDQHDSKRAELSKTDTQNENDKVDLKDTTEQLEADRVFLADLKARCATMDDEWAARQKMRQDEKESIAKAIEIISDNDARDLTSKTTGAALVQLMRDSSEKAKSQKVIQFLQRAGAKMNKPKLMLFAASMKNDVFGKMKKDVDKMIARLTQEQKDEVKFKDYCIEELHQNGLDQDEKYHEKKNLDNRYADLESEIKRLTEEMKVARAEIAEMQIEMKKAAETREKESKNTEQLIADQRATIEVLNKAVTALNKFYDKKKKAALIQAKSAQAPPPTFQPYVKAGGVDVVSMIQTIIKDSKYCIKMAYAENHQSQLAYEEFMRDLNKDIAALKKQIADQTEQIAVDDADMARTKEDLAQNLKDLEAVNELNQNLHVECDFVMKNFEQRQASRITEIDSLNDAKAMMSQAA
jgi:hypothetical protein